MLRVVVRNFLESLTEREFDAPLLAILSAQGFTDIHFIHGGFEFGKDVIAKRRRSDTGEWCQYSIQSKAGDIGLSEWRAVRPQLEECSYNTIAHPSFDADLPRVAVLVTTGRLKGAAPVDAQAFRSRCKNIGLSDFEAWDCDTLADWMVGDPSVGLAGASVADELIEIVGSVRRAMVSEPILERHTRAWIATDRDPVRLRRACLETSILCAGLRERRRLDLAALLALHLLRAAWCEPPTRRAPEAGSALRLFEWYATELLDQVEPCLDDPKKLVRPADIASLVTYPAACCRITEIISLLALVSSEGSVQARARQATSALCERHPGTTRPPSDQFAVSLIPAVLVLAQRDREGARSYLRRVAQWVLDRHDPACNGLGLASMDEDESIATERLVAGALTSTKLSVRKSSYIATVVLDLLVLLDQPELRDAFLSNLEALDIMPTIAASNETRARWRRGGPGVSMQTRVDYLAWTGSRSQQVARTDSVDPLTALLLTAVARSRHDIATFRGLLNEVAAM